MSNRRRRRKRCQDCPDQPVTQAATKAAAHLSNVSISPTLLTMPSEADKLWRHVLFGTGTCVGMIEGYARLGMPGNPIPHLHSLVNRLVAVIKQLEHGTETPEIPAPGNPSDPDDPEPHAGED